MRLWSIHPAYLDAAGLVACWREALLARAVLAGKTKGYRNHPQLLRFRAHPRPRAAINEYLRVVYRESVRRNYRFSPDKIGAARTRARIPVTAGQLRYELKHLRKKLGRRNKRWLAGAGPTARPEPHPLFAIIPGEAEHWERTVRGM